MSDFFVNSNASGSNDGSTWANAFATFSLGVAALSANDRLIVANVHSETLPGTSSFTLPSNSIITSSTVSGSTTVTSIKATSVQVESISNHTITMTGNSSSAYGLKLDIGNKFNVRDVTFDDCDIDVARTDNFGGMIITSQDAWLKLINTHVFCDRTSRNAPIIDVTSRCQLYMLAGSIGGTSASVNQKPIRVQDGATISVDSVDFSDSLNTTLIDANNEKVGRIRVVNCAINANVTDLISSPAVGASDIIFENTGNANTSFRRYRPVKYGELFSESVIKLSDSNFSASNKLVSNANSSEFFSPLRVLLNTDFADFSTSKTITIEVAQDGTTTGLTDTEFWIEIVYPDDTTNEYHFESSRAVNSASGSLLTSSAESYDGLSGTNTKQKIEITTTQTGKDGAFELFGCLAKTSTTAYITVSSIA
jgi:hypothetical protein